MAKTTYYLALFYLRGCLTLLGQSYDLTEILMAIGAGRNMLPPGETRGVGRKYTVFVRGLGRWRHDTIGRKDDRTVESGKLLTLFPPRVTIVTHQMAILFQLRIIVGRQHFAMGINIYSGTFGLYEQVLYILKIMARNEYAGVLAHADVYLRYLGITISARIGLIEQGHDVDPELARFQDIAEQLVHRGVGIGNNGQGLKHEINDRLVAFAQAGGMLIVGRHAL